MQRRAAVGPGPRGIGSGSSASFLCTLSSTSRTRLVLGLVAGALLAWAPLQHQQDRAPARTGRARSQLEMGWSGTSTAFAPTRTRRRGGAGQILLVKARSRPLRVGVISLQSAGFWCCIRSDSDTAAGWRRTDPASKGSAQIRPVKIRSSPLGVGATRVAACACDGCLRLRRQRPAAA